MHYSDIEEGANLQHVEADLRDSLYGDRPILLGYLMEIDGTDILVPVQEAGHWAASMVALTAEQGQQALLLLASQIGKEKAIELITKGGG